MDNTKDKKNTYSIPSHLLQYDEKNDCFILEINPENLRKIFDAERTSFQN